MKRFLQRELFLIVILIGAAIQLTNAQSLNYGYAHDLSNGATFESSSFSVGSQVGAPSDIAFSKDGLSMFILDPSNREIEIYALTTPFETSSGVSVNGTPFSVVTEEINPNGIDFSDSGHKMYVTGTSGDDVTAYSLSNPFDLSTGVSVDGTPFSLTSQFSNPRDVFVSTDGSKMFVLEQDQIYQYSLSIPYRVLSGVTYDNVVFSIASQDTQGFSLSFNDDGTKMFVTGGTGLDINQYSLTTPFDLSSGVSLEGSPFAVSAQETQPKSVDFSTDGRTMFVVGWSGDDINQYSLNADANFMETGSNDGTVSGSINIDITGDTFTHTSSTLVVNTDYSITNLPAGFTSVVTVAGNGLSAVLTLTGKADNHNSSDNIESLEFNFENSAFAADDAASVLNATSYESYFGIDYDDNSALLTYGTNFDLSYSPTLDGDYSVEGQENSPSGVAFSKSGDRMFVTGRSGDNVYQYNLTTPFDVTSGASYAGSPFSVDSPESIAFSEEGNHMYILRDGPTGQQYIYQYDLTTAFDVTSGVTLNSTLYVGTIDNNPRGISLSADGHKLFMVGFEGGEVNQYSLTEPYELGTNVSYDGSPFSVSGQETGPTGIAFNQSGTKMFVMGQTGDKVNMYNLTSPFDITSGVTFSNTTFDLSGSGEVFPQDMAFDTDGGKLYMVGGATNKIYQYNLNVEDDFSETIANAGIVESANLSATITISGDTFTNAGGNLTSGSHYSISNLPAGLTPTISVAANGLSATLSLSGTVSNHQASNNIESLIISFENGAFTGGNASTISNTTNASSGFAIDFSDNPVLTYGYEAFDFDAGPTFDGSPFSIGSLQASSTGIDFSSDGTKMYVIGTSFNRLVEYDLTVPFDVTSGVVFNDFTAVASNPSGVTFNNDGSKMFVLFGASGSSDAVWEYDLSVAYDIETLSFVDFFDVSSEELQPSGIRFNTDGTKMYIVGYSGDEVNQYSLSSGFSLSSVALDGTAPVIQDPDDIAFNGDGSVMFILSTAFDNVARYDLSVPFDITAGFVSAGNSYSVAAQDTAPTGLAFSPDGSKMFMVGSTGDDVNQYSIETGGFNEVAANDGTVEGGLTVRIDGDTFTNGGSTLTSPTDFVITNLPAGLTPVLNVAADGFSGEVQITGTAGTQNIDDINSLIFTFENSAFTTNPASAVVNGTSAESGFGIDFIDGPELIYTSLNYDLSAGATFDGSPFGFGTEETTPTDITFNDDGLKMYVLGVISDKVHQYGLTTPFDVTSGVSLETSFSVATQEINPTGVEFNANGSKLYILGATGDDINQYSLSSNFDLNSTVVFEGNFSISAQESTPQGFAFNTDGSRMFVTGSSGDDVNQYSLTTPFDITGTVKFSGAFSVASEDGFPADIAFSSDGLKMYISGVIGDDINIYSLQSPFTITSGVSFQSSFSIASEETSATGFAFSHDGSKMFIAGQVGDDVNQYSVNTVGFTEATANDGSVNGAILISIAEDTFTSQGGTLSETTDYTITNLASGLIPTMSVSADGLSATLTIGGNATSNFDADDISSLQFTFENSAFTNSDASDVANAIGAESNFGIDFFGAPSAPTDISLNSNSIDENETSGTMVGSFTTTDVDAGETYTYTLVAGSGDTDNGSFTIDDNQLKSAVIFDFETKSSYSVRVNTNDGNGGSFAKQFTIDINDVSEAPTDLSIDLSSIDENNVVDANIGQLTTVDVDAGETYTYTKVAGTGDDDNASFNILGNQLRATDVFDFETKSSYSVRVNTNDGNGGDFERSFIITINDISETPTDILLDATAIAENNSVNDVIGQLSTTDDDGGETYTYTKVAGTGDDDNASFNILGNQLRATDVFDFETKSSYSVRVNTNDGNGGDFERSFIITINDISETPTDILLDATAIAENNSVNDVIGQLSTTDDDGGETYTYTKVAGTGDDDNASFNILGNQLRATDVFDFETKSSYSVRVNTNDGNGGNFAKSFTISINDVVEIISWNGFTWSNVTGPTAADDAEINGTFNTVTNGNVIANDLTINSGASVTVADGNHIEVYGNLAHNGASFTVESGGSLVTKGNVTGTNFTFERTTTFDENTGRYSIVGSPISGANFSTLGSNVIIYGYDETQPYNISGNEGLDRFQTPATLGHSTMQVGTGYFSAKTGDANGLITFAGTPNNGTQNVSLSITDHPSNEDVFEGFNLVSNPYPCALNYTSFIFGNSFDIESAIYLWDDFDSETTRGTNADYVVINSMGNVDSRKAGLSKWDGNIRSMQGFFVQAKGTGDLQLDFTDAMKVTANNDDAGYYRTTNEQVSFKLVLESSEGSYAETLIGMRDDASLEKDQFDARLFSPAKTTIYSQISGEAYAIQGMPRMNAFEVPLGIKTELSGTYEISIDELENLEGYNIILKDHLLNIATEISSGNTYRFSSNEQVSNNRFSVVASNEVTNIKELVIENLIVFQNERRNLIIRTAKDQEIRFAELISLTGQSQRLELTQLNSNEWQTKQIYQTGLFMIRISTGKEEPVQKIILR